MLNESVTGYGAVGRAIVARLTQTGCLNRVANWQSFFKIAHRMDVAKLS